MSARYGPLNTRARGLAQHLCPRATLERWAALPDAAALGRAWQAERPDALPLPPNAGAAEVDDAVRRWTAATLATFARWADDDDPLLAALHAGQDRASLRALLRGALEGAAPAQRLAGTGPTPRLTPARLAELAQARSPREIAARLLVYGDPHAAALLPLTALARQDAFMLERALAGVLADRWRRAAARADAALRETLRERIDLVNAVAALELAGTPAREFDAAAIFVEGGTALRAADFARAAAAPGGEEAGARLARSLAGRPLGRWVASAGGSATHLQASADTDLLHRLRARSRTEPLGSAPAQWFLARLQAQAQDLRRLAWGLELGQPPARLRRELHTPWH